MDFAARDGESSGSHTIATVNGSRWIQGRGGAG